MLMKIGPMLKNSGRVLLHIVMVGLLSQVMDNTIVNVVNENVVNENMNVVNVVYLVKDNMGVVAVLAMHSVIVDKIIERMCAHKVMRNANVNSMMLAVFAMNMDHVDVDGNSVNKDNPEQVLTSQVVGVVNMNEVYVDVDVIDEKTVEKQVVGVNKDTEEESEKRDVMGNINPESSYDEVAEMMEKDYSQEAGFEEAFADEETGEDDDDDNDKDISKEEDEPEKRDRARSSSIAYFTRQSSTKTEAVHRY
jgi:hypothetical protein